MDKLIKGHLQIYSQHSNPFKRKKLIREVKERMFILSNNKLLSICMEAKLCQLLLILLKHLWCSLLCSSFSRL